MKLLLLFSLIASSVAIAAERPMARTMNDKELKWSPCPAIFPEGCELSVLRETSEKKNTDVYLKFPANYTVPAHTHTSSEHMTLVSGELNVKYKGEKEVKLTPGSFGYSPANHPHEAKCVSNEPCVLFISFDEPIDAKAYTGKL